LVALLALAAGAAAMALVAVPTAAEATPAATSAGTAPGHTIASAGTLSMGGTVSGGGGPVDFWKVKLLGGDVMQLQADLPSNTCCSSNYRFELFPPTTTDANFPQTSPVLDDNVGSSTKAVVDLQAPYNATFILAVCENIGGDCRGTDSGQGSNPMAAYSFKPSLVGGGIKASVGAKETRASDTLAKAPLTPLGNFESGGGQPIDFWKVKLLGGDQVQLALSLPFNVCCSSSYDFNLYPPGTTDTNFPQVNPVANVSVGSSTKSVVVLQAPYNATFVLAICQNVSGDCRSVDSGHGTNPMSPYTFTPTLVGGGIKATVGAKETRAGDTIARAKVTPLGNFESGGGQPIDFWKVKLLGGDQVQLALSLPYNLCCSSSYDFNLYPPGITDTKFPQVAPVANVSVGSSTKAAITLKAPRSGTYTLAICQNVSGDCRTVDSGGGTNPMSAYTFTPTLVGGTETKTSLFLSASSIKHGSEKKLKVSVKVAAQFSGHPAGTVTILAGKKVVCRAKLAKGKGSCSPSSNTLLSPGTYSLVASFPGSKGSAASKSGPKTLVVKK
jgi:lipid-A-disaccharide synthase-like uncharacterized protein